MNKANFRKPYSKKHLIKFWERAKFKSCVVSRPLGLGRRAAGRAGIGHELINKAAKGAGGRPLGFIHGLLCLFACY